jgi:hypothetical protein
MDQSCDVVCKTPTRAREDLVYLRPGQNPSAGALKSLHVNGHEEAILAHQVDVPVPLLCSSFSFPHSMSPGTQHPYPPQTSTFLCSPSLKYFQPSYTSSSIACISSLHTIHLCPFPSSLSRQSPGAGAPLFRVAAGFSPGRLLGPPLLSSAHPPLPTTLGFLLRSSPRPFYAGIYSHSTLPISCFLHRRRSCASAVTSTLCSRQCGTCRSSQLD